MRTAGNGIELAPKNFNSSPSGPRGGTVFNFRSAGRCFREEQPMSHPGVSIRIHRKKYPKAKHRFTLNDAPFTAVAGILREGITHRATQSAN